MSSDKDNDGLVNATELGEFMRSEGMHPTQTELDIMMKDLDHDGVPGISFNEFLWMIAAQVGTTPEDNSTNETSFWEEFTCAAGEEVPCPVSGQICSGSTCCPGVQESGGFPFPCPSAENNFCSCSNRTKLQDCVKEPDVECKGICNEAYCDDMVNSYKGWPRACEAAQGQCDGCKGCCASRKPDGTFV